MKNLVIVGAGGMGRSVYCIAIGSIGYNKDFIIKGFIDDDLRALNDFVGYPPIIGTIAEYKPDVNDVFVCSVGNTKTKKIICEKLKEKGAIFHKLVHKTAIVRQNAVIGEGTIVADYASVGADAVIGCNSLIQSYSIVAHDCIIGDYVRIDTHAVCVGGVKVQDIATVHTGAILSHKVIVEEGATVGAASFVFKRVKAGRSVFGNPAKYLD